MTDHETAAVAERELDGILEDMVLDSPDVEHFLAQLTRLAARSLLAPDSEVECSTTLLRPRKTATIASTSIRALDMDEFQYSLGDGPCLAAARTRRIVYVRDIDRDTRWPQYQQAAGSGFRSVLGVPIPIDGEASASLNLYSTSAAAFDEEALEAARTFARLASKSLRLAVRIAHLSDTAHDLRAAMESRTTIGLAAGILMGQNGCTKDAAMTILKQASTDRNLKLRDIAAAVVAAADGRDG
jgi:GAF domain-containing protein